MLQAMDDEEVCVLVNRLVPSPIARKLLPCRLAPSVASHARAATTGDTASLNGNKLLPSSTSGPSTVIEAIEIVVVKDLDLELVSYDPVSNAWKTRLSQHMFGRIFDAAVFRPSLFAPPDFSGPSFEGTERKDYTGGLGDLLIVISDSGCVTVLTLCEGAPVQSSSLLVPQRAFDDGESNQSEFECVDEDELWPVRFHSVHQILLDTSHSPIKSPMRTICVDPLSRAIMAGSLLDGLLLFHVEAVAQKSAPLSLSTGVFIEPVGSFLGSCFLYPTTNEMGRVSLLVFSTKEGRVEISAYEMARSFPDRVIRVASLVLKSGTVFVGKVVALANLPNSAVFATDKHFCCIRLKSTSTSFDLSIVSEEPISWKGVPGIKDLQSAGESAPSDIVTSLAQSVLEPAASANINLIYATSAAGYITRLIVNKTTWAISLTDLGIRQPIALAEVIHSSRSRHYLAVVGDMCDGEVLLMDFQELSLRRQCLIENWAPLTDFALADPEDSGFDTMFLSSGWLQSGRVHRLQKGILSTSDDFAAGFDGANGLWTFSCSRGSETNSYLAVSFVNASRLLFEFEDRIEDVTDSSGIEQDVASVYIGLIPSENLIVQAYAKGIVVTSADIAHGAGKRSLWNASSNSRIVMASSVGNRICALVNDPRHLIIFVVAVEGDIVVIEELAREPIDCAVSMLQCLFSQSDSLCFVGTYELKVKAYSLAVEEPLSSCKELDIADDVGRSIRFPHSCQIIRNKDGFFLLIGLRDGHILVYAIEGAQYKFVDQVRVGHQPVTLDTHSSESIFAVASAEKLWRAEMRRGRLFIAPILVAGSSFKASKIASFPSYLTRSGFGYAVIADDHLRLISVSSKIEPILSGFPLLAAKTPKRIIYDAVTKNLIVACSGIGATSGQLKLINARSGAQILKEMLQEGESCLCLSSWQVKEGKRYICAGTWGYKDPTDQTAAEEGRVLVFSLKPEPRARVGYRMRKLGEYKFPSRVVAVRSFLNSYLVAAAGNVLVQLKIDANSRTLVAGARVELRWPILSLSASGQNVFIGGKRDSISLYVYDTQSKEFVFQMSDSVQRVTGDCLAINDSLTLASDRSGNVFGLRNLLYPAPLRRADPLEHQFGTQFCVNLGENILRLKSGCVEHQRSVEPLFATWEADASTESREILDAGWGTLPAESSKQADGAKSTEDGPRRHVVVYGCGVSGSIFAFHRITKASFARLRLVQDFLASHPSTRPLLGNDFFAFRSWSPSTPMRNVIDGELLLAFRRLAPEEQLRCMDEFRRLSK
ncbi:mono-functional DNA-alkylating methyl methanesulfonate N-term-domain-containing protein [Zopfochytrium polystomum]|nr:mono-functional DNA-alkylating methyl methanesulfonate N-term-domain-containing protein [Zopfochytrium polystomum]